MPNESEALRLSRLADDAAKRADSASNQGRYNEAQYWGDRAREYARLATRAQEEERAHLS